jgi:hypothetical protein
MISLPRDAPSINAVQVLGPNPCGFMRRQLGEPVFGQVIERCEALFFPFPSHRNKFSTTGVGMYSLLALLR